MMLKGYFRAMRTTLTLEPDVAEAIDREVRRRPKATFKQVVNELLRAGLHAKQQTKPRRKFKVRAQAMGIVPGVDYDKISSLIEISEGPWHR